MRAPVGVERRRAIGRATDGGQAPWASGRRRVGDASCRSGRDKPPGSAGSLTTFPSLSLDAIHRSEFTHSHRHTPRWLKPRGPSFGKRPDPPVRQSREQTRYVLHEVRNSAVLYTVLPESRIVSPKLRPVKDLVKCDRSIRRSELFSRYSETFPINAK